MGTYLDKDQFYSVDLGKYGSERGDIYESKDKLREDV